MLRNENSPVALIFGSPPFTPDCIKCRLITGIKNHFYSLERRLPGVIRVRLTIPDGADNMLYAQEQIGSELIGQLTTYELNGLIQSRCGWCKGNNPKTERVAKITETNIPNRFGVTFLY
jgi:hypothetical protein